MDLLDFLLGLPDPLPIGGSESDTRAKIIDPILESIGWSPNEIRREPYSGWSDSRGFIDYLLLIEQRPMVVIEAKKTGRSFKIPDKLASQRATSYRKLRATGSDDLKEALEQCLRYAQHTGALYACATNGADWVFFKPTHPFRALPEARVVIFNGIEQITKRIDEFSDLISPNGVQEGRAEKHLLGRDIQIPTFSKRLQDAFQHRADMSLEEEDYSNILDKLLKHYVIDLTDEVDFQECYIPAKGNRSTSGTLEALISGRIEALKTPIGQAALDFGSQMLSKPALPNVTTGRTVILHGEVGVGKTSFLRHCQLSLKSEGKLQDAVWARIDLLPFEDRQFDPAEVKQMLDLICRQIQDEVSVVTDNMSGSYDPDAWSHLRDIYNAEVRKFQKARYPDSDDKDQIFLDAARQYVWDLCRADPQEHLIRIIRWLTVNCKLPVIVVLDNSDQLGLKFQEFLYKLSETLQASTSAVVILVLRTEALASHVIREHSIASVREQFLVQKAPLAQILKRRFSNILQRLPEAYPGSAEKVARDRISVLMETLEQEADLGSESFQLVQAAGGGSLRDNLRAISAIFRSSPRTMDRLVVSHAENGRARLTTTQTLRALMREDLSNPDSNKLIPNVFDVDGQITMPYSLGVRELQQIRSKEAYAECTVSTLLNNLSIAGIDRTIAERTLIRMRSQRFLSVTHMLPELRDTDSLKITRLGIALLDIILSEASYFSRAAFNTYIYVKETYQNMRSAWTSDADYRLRFDAIARQFVELIVDDDASLRRRIDVSLLEPVISQPLPGLLDGRHMKGGITEEAESSGE